jgi:hypothetical protein
MRAKEGKLARRKAIREEVFVDQIKRRRLAKRPVRVSACG